MQPHRLTHLAAGRLVALLALVCLAGCARSQTDDGSVAWSPPPDSAIPMDSLGAAIRRGQAIMRNTPDSLPEFALSSLNCTSCHLADARQVGAAPLLGVVARFPKFLDRVGAVIPVEDRINYCMTRSLAGLRLPTHSREMQDMVAYLAFLSRGLPVGSAPDSLGIPAIPAMEGDSARGHAVYATTCAACHGLDGEGGVVPRAPALWGARSFSIGASMARIEVAAAFVRHNMPLSQPGSLTDQQAWDVAAYLNRQPRPDMPAKEQDWPLGGAPAGVPYNTVGHESTDSRLLLPRVSPERAVVPPPEPARQGGR